MARSRSLNVVVSGDARALERAFRSAARSTNQLEVSARRSTDRIRHAYGALAGAAGIGGLTAGLVTAAKTGIAFNARMESSELALRRFVGTGRETQKFLQEMFQLAKQTPFEFPELVEASRRLMAFGMTAKDTKETLTAVGDAVAAAGGGSEQIQRVTLALGQMQAKGKVSAEELLQLTEAGIPAYKILRDELNLTNDQVAKIGTLGIPAGKAIKALTDGMTRNFKGAAKEQSTRWAGKTSSMKDNLAQATGAITQGLFQHLKKWAPAVNTTFGDIARIFGRKDIDIGEKFKLSRASISRNLGPVASEIGRMLDRADIPTKLSKAFEAAVPKIMNAMASAAPRVAEAFVRAWANAGAWARLFTFALIAKRLGVFSRAGVVAGGMFSQGFGAGGAGGSGGGAAPSSPMGRAVSKFGRVIRAAGWVGWGVAAADAFIPGFHRQLEEASGLKKPKFFEELERYSRDYGARLRRDIEDAIGAAQIAIDVDRGPAGPHGWNTGKGARPAPSPNAGKGGGAQRERSAPRAVTSAVRSAARAVVASAASASAPVAAMARMASTSPVAHASSSNIQLAADALYRAGFRGQTLLNFLAIAGRESGWDPTRTNLKGRDHSIGLLQINQLAHHGRFGTDRQLMDPYRNARAAFSLYRQAGYSPWKTAGGNWRGGISTSIWQRAARVAPRVGAARRGGAGGGGFDPTWANRSIGHFPESGGANRGRELDSLERGFGMTGAPWCAIFATTAAVKGGAPASIKTASVAQINQWASQGSHGYEKGLKSTPRPGDLMTFGTRHVVIVMRVNRGTVSTLSGNSNRGPDGGVVRATYPIGAGTYARPRYPGSRGVDGAGTGTGGFSAGSVVQSNFQAVSSRLETIGMRRDAGEIGAGTADKRILSTIGAALQGRFGSLSGRDRLQLKVTRRQTQQGLKRRRKDLAEKRSHGPYNEFVKAFNRIQLNVDLGYLSPEQGRQEQMRYCLYALDGQYGPLAPGDRNEVAKTLRELQSNAPEGPDPTTFEGTAFDDAALTMAQVNTPNDLTDDRAVLTGRLQIATAAYNQAVANNDRAGISTWGGIVQSLRSDLGQADGGSASDLAAELKALREEIAKYNNYAAQVTSVSLGEAWRAMADTLSGQIAGVGYSGRAASAGDGSIARW